MAETDVRPAWLSTRPDRGTVRRDQFAAMLHLLESSHANVTFINGQGTLAPQPSSWHNELHPSKNGFNTFAALFYRILKAAFPDRVL